MFCYDDRAMIVPENVREELRWELIGHRLDRMLEKGLEAGPGKAPLRELHLELTHRCNLKCLMCEHWSIQFDDPRSVKREMTLEKIAELADSPLFSDVESVAVTGGEPWLRADIEDILRVLSEKLPKASIIVLTNFWNTGHLERRLANLRARGIKLKLGSSLDGLESTHDEIRGQPGAFAGLVKTVRTLRARFPEIAFGFTLTIQPRNAHEVYAVYRFVTGELGASLGAQWVIERPGVPPPAWTVELKERALAGIRGIVVDLARKHDALDRLGDARENRWLWSELLYWRYLERYGRAPERFGFFERCLAGERHFMVGPEGEVFFCPVNKERTVGNINAAAPEAIWSSSEAQAERRFVAEKKCSCWLRCTATPALDRLIDSAVSAA